MIKKNITKETAIKAVQKMISNKEAVRAYLKGQCTLEDLNKKGIKIAKSV